MEIGKKERTRNSFGKDFFIRVGWPGNQDSISDNGKLLISTQLPYWIWVQRRLHSKLCRG